MPLLAHVRAATFVATLALTACASAARRPNKARPTGSKALAKTSRFASKAKSSSPTAGPPPMSSLPAD